MKNAYVIRRELKEENKKNTFYISLLTVYACTERIWYTKTVYG